MLIVRNKTRQNIHLFCFDYALFYKQNWYKLYSYNLSFIEKLKYSILKS